MSKINLWSRIRTKTKSRSPSQRGPTASGRAEDQVVKRDILGSILNADDVLDKILDSSEAPNAEALLGLSRLSGPLMATARFGRK